MTPLPKGIRSPIVLHGDNGIRVLFATRKSDGKVCVWQLHEGNWCLHLTYEEPEGKAFYAHNKGLELVA